MLILSLVIPEFSLLDLAIVCEKHFIDSDCTQPIMTFNAPDLVFTLSQFGGPGTMDPSIMTISSLSCSKVSVGFCQYEAPTRGLEAGRKSLPVSLWLDCPLPKVTAPLRWPSVEHFPPSLYYSCSFFFSGLRILPDLITFWYHITAFFPPMYLAHTFENGLYSPTSICLILACHLLSDYYWQWQFLRLLDKSQSHPEELKGMHQRRPEFCFTETGKIGKLISRVMNKKES